MPSSGPKGTGKTTLVRSIMKGRPFCVRIDCAAARLTDNSGTTDSGSTFLDILERAVGFAPSFSALTTFTAYFESFFPMKKNVLSSSLKSQLTHVLTTLENALRIVSTTYPRDHKKPYNYSLIVFDSFHELIQSMEDVSNEERKKAQTLFEVLMKFVVHVTQVNIFVSCNHNVQRREMMHMYFSVLLSSSARPHGARGVCDRQPLVRGFPQQIPRVAWTHACCEDE